MIHVDNDLPRLYRELSDWWPLISPREDYAVEADHHLRLLTRHARRPIETLLELGCGGGNNAFYLRKRARLTLTDLSPAMLAVSRGVNPNCVHILGDMRSLRLTAHDEQPGLCAFDAVLVHDAIMYMRSEADLLAAMRTAFIHCAPGGAALFVPDCVRETWAASTGHGGRDGSDGRAVRFLDWTRDADPDGTEYEVDIVYILRGADGTVRIAQDCHRFGLFPVATWMRLLAEAGFEPTVEPCDYPGAERARSFIGVRRVDRASSRR